MRAGPLSSMLAGLKDQWEDETRFRNFLRPQSPECAGAQEHKRDVSVGDLRGVRDLHACAAP